MEVYGIIIESGVKFTEKTNVLDVGCGVGELISIINKKHKSNVFGIDPERYEKAQKNCPELSKKISNGVGEDLKFESEYFDVIIFNKSFHHCKDKEKAAKEAERCLKKKGKIVFIEPIFDMNKETSSIKLHFLPVKMNGEERKPGENHHHHHHEHHEHHHEKKEDGHHEHHKKNEHLSYDFKGAQSFVRKGTDTLKCIHEKEYEYLLTDEEIIEMNERMSLVKCHEKYIKAVKDYTNMLKKKLNVDEVKYDWKLRINVLERK